MTSQLLKFYRPVLRMLGWVYAVKRNVTIMTNCYGGIHLRETRASSIRVETCLHFCVSYIYALGYRLDDRGSRVRFPARAGNFSLHHRVQNGSGAHQPPTQWVPGAPSLGVKRSGREAYHSPPSSAEVKEWVELYIHSPNTPSWRGA
jgi:hypothetical protein